MFDWKKLLVELLSLLVLLLGGCATEGGNAAASLSGDPQITLLNQPAEVTP